MNFHGLRLISFGKSRSPSKTTTSKTTSKVPSKKLNENIHIKKPSSSNKKLATNEVKNNKSATINISNKSSERKPIRRQSKSETAVNFSISKMLENLGHRNTASLSDIKRFTRCCTKRFRQTLQMFRTRSDPKTETTNKAAVRSSKQIEVLSAPNLNFKKKNSTEERIRAPSSNKADSFQKKIPIFNLYSITRDSYNRNRTRKKLNHDKSAPTLRKTSRSRKCFKSDSLLQCHFNVVKFSPIASKQSKHIKIQSITREECEINKHSRIDVKPEPLLCNIPMESNDCIKDLQSNKDEKNAICYNVHTVYGPDINVPMCMVMPDPCPQKIKHKNCIERCISKLRQTVPCQFFPKKEFWCRRFFRYIVFWLIIFMWAPCICSLVCSWCMIFPFKQRDNADGTCIYHPQDPCTCKDSLVDCCCGWTHVISRILGCSNSRTKIIKVQPECQTVPTPHEDISLALLQSGSLTRRLGNNKRCLLIYKDQKGWTARPIKPVLSQQNMIAKDDSCNYMRGSCHRMGRKKKQRCDKKAIPQKPCNHNNHNSGFKNYCRSFKSHNHNNSFKNDCRRCFKSKTHRIDAQTDMASGAPCRYYKPPCVDAPIYGAYKPKCDNKCGKCGKAKYPTSTNYPIQNNYLGTGDIWAKGQNGYKYNVYTSTTRRAAGDSNACLGAHRGRRTKNNKTCPCEAGNTKVTKKVKRQQRQPTLTSMPLQVYNMSPVRECIEALCTCHENEEQTPRVPQVRNIPEVSQNEPGRFQIQINPGRLQQRQKPRQPSPTRHVHCSTSCQPSVPECYKPPSLICRFINYMISPTFPPCENVFLQTLTHQPCFKYFEKRQWLYPYFLDCRHTCINVLYGCFMCLAGLCYSPLIVCCYVGSIVCGRILCLAG